MDQKDILLILFIIILVIFIVHLVMNRNSIPTGQRVQGECVGNSDCPGDAFCEAGQCITPIIEPETGPTCECEIGTEVAFDYGQPFLPWLARSTRTGHYVLGFDQLTFPPYNAYLCRFDENGFDTSYGTAGFLLLQMGGITGTERFPRDFAVNTDGTIVIKSFTGGISGGLDWEKLDANGIYIPGALQSTDLPIDPCPQPACTWQRQLVREGPDGTYYIKGYSSLTAGLGNVLTYMTKFTSSGIDTSYGTGGTFEFRLTEPLNGETGNRSQYSADNMKVADDGTVYIFSSVQYDDPIESWTNRPAVTKILPNGSLDTSYGFNNTGSAWAIDMPMEAGPYTHQGHILEDGSVIFTGFGCEPDCSTEAFGAVKFDPSGQVDASWGDNGYFVYGTVGNYTETYQSALTPCGGLVVTGSVYNSSFQDPHLIVIHLDENGQLKQDIYESTAIGTEVTDANMDLGLFSNADDSFTIYTSGELAPGGGNSARGTYVLECSS